MTEKERNRFRHWAARLKQEGYAQITFTAVDTYERFTSTSGTQIDRRQDAVDHLYIAEAAREGKRGCVYWTQLPQTEEMMARLKEAVKASGQEPKSLDRIGEGGCFSGREISMGFEPHEDILQKFLSTGEEAKEAPGRSHLTRLSYIQNQVDIYVCGEDGLEYGDTSGYHCLEVEHKLRQGKEAAVARMSCYCKAIRELSLKELVRAEARKAAQELGSRPVASGRYPVIFNNTVMAEMLEAYLPAFYGDWILSRRSFMAGRLGRRVAAVGVNVREVPALEQGRSCRQIDDEGYPVQEKYLIRDGIFTTALLNQRLAHLLKLRNTGNGFRSGPFNEDGIGVTNILLEGQAPCPPEQLLERLGCGLLITGVEGLMAGTDIRTGQFSLLVKGRKIENGRESGAFCQVTIAGNFFAMLEEIRMIGDDYAPTGPDSECVLAPSVFVGDLAVSGA